MRLECHRPVQPIVTVRRLSSGGQAREKANPITPIVNLHTGFIHYARLGPIDQHFSGRTLAYYNDEDRKIHIRAPFAESHMFYEELCMRGLPERGIEPSPGHWERFEVLRKVLYNNERPSNVPEDFWHPYVVQRKKSKSSGLTVDLGKLLDEGDEGDA